MKKNLVVLLIGMAVVSAAHARSFDINPVEYRQMVKLANPPQNDDGLEMGRVYVLASNMQGGKATCQSFAMGAINNSGYKIRYGNQYLYPAESFNGSVLNNSETGESIGFNEYAAMCMKNYGPVLEMVRADEEKNKAMLKEQQAKASAARQAETDRMEAIRAQQRIEQAEQAKVGAAKQAEYEAWKQRQAEDLAARQAARQYDRIGPPPVSNLPPQNMPQQNAQVPVSMNDAVNAFGTILKIMR